MFEREKTLARAPLLPSSLALTIRVYVARIHDVDLVLNEERLKRRLHFRAVRRMLRVRVVPRRCIGDWGGGRTK